MSNFSAIRESVAFALNTVDFGSKEDSNIEKIICGVGLHKLVESIIQTSNEFSGKLNSLAISYVSTYQTEVKNMNGKNISFVYMKRNILDWGLKDYGKITHSQLNKLYSFYTDKSEIVKFSSLYYKSGMYGALNISYKADEYLGMIHKELMSPIANYYKNRYGILNSAVQIYDALGSALNPGKVIIFSITGVPEYTIVKDVKGQKIQSIQKHIYNIDLYQNHVRIVTK